MKENFVWWWINITSCEANLPRRLKRNFANIMVEMFLQGEGFLNSFKLFGVWAWAQVSLNDVDALLRTLHQKSLMESMIYWSIQVARRKFMTFPQNSPFTLQNTLAHSSEVADVDGVRISTYSSFSLHSKSAYLGL